MKSHRLVKFAKDRHHVDTGISNAAIFTALYEKGKNVSLTDTLVEIAKDDLGLDLSEEDLRQYLDSKENEAEVEAEIERGRRMYRISGVPFFVIQKEGGDEPPYGLSGAQKSETFLNIFDDLLE